MSRPILRLVLLCIVLGFYWFVGKNGKAPQAGTSPASSESRPSTSGDGNARATWGHTDSLPDHFARHGRDFHARDAEDYAAQAAAFLQRARTEGLPAESETTPTGRCESMIRRRVPSAPTIATAPPAPISSLGIRTIFSASPGHRWISARSDEILLPGLRLAGSPRAATRRGGRCVLRDLSLVRL